MFGRAPSNSDSLWELREVILWVKVIFFDSLAYVLKIMTENRITESREATFFGSCPLSSFRESLHRVNRESILSEKLFDKIPAGFSRESTLKVLPNMTKIYYHLYTKNNIILNVFNCVFIRYLKFDQIYR